MSTHSWTLWGRGLFLVSGSSSNNKADTMEAQPNSTMITPWLSRPLENKHKLHSNIQYCIGQHVPPLIANVCCIKNLTTDHPHSEHPETHILLLICWKVAILMKKVYFDFNERFTRSRQWVVSSTIIGCEISTEAFTCDSSCYTLQCIFQLVISKQAEG